MNLTIGLFAIPKNNSDLYAECAKRYASRAQRVLFNLINRALKGLTHER